MVATAKPFERKLTPQHWQQFLGMRPAIIRIARRAFRGRNRDAREEMTADVVAAAYVMFVRLVQRGLENLAFASPLGNYGVRQAKDGRKVGMKLNIGDVLSMHCQQRKGVTVERLDRFDEEENQWREAVVEDTRSAPVPDVVCFRVDFGDWLGRLSRRSRRMAEFLALGNRTTDAARKFKISAGRVSQIRGELAESWEEFQGEDQGCLAIA